MATLASVNLPPPRDWDHFENIVLAASKLRWNSDAFFRNGRQGQAQMGVDIWSTAGGPAIGVQCKNTPEGLTLAVVEAEIAAAERFTPKLDHLHIATSAKRDAPLQTAVRLLSQSRGERGLFPVDILFWEDICQDLARDQEEVFTLYPEFRPRLNKAREQDEKLFESFMALLPSDGTIGYIDEHGLAAPFVRDRLEPLTEFYYGWKKPEREFLNAELDELRKALWRKTDDLLEVVGAMTIPFNHNMDYQVIPPEWKHRAPDRYQEAIAALNTTSRAVVTAHREFVRRARALLYG